MSNSRVLGGGQCEGAGRRRADAVGTVARALPQA